MNKTEISKETLAKVFAPYIGQVYECRNYRYKLNSVGVASGFNNGHKFEDCMLHLTPLSNITDEVAIEVAKLRYVDYETCHIDEKRLCVKAAKNAIKKPESLPTITAQYLISSGYDLPNYHLNGQTLIQANLALDKTLITK